MTTKQITLTQTKNDDDRYTVDSLVNRIEPRVGDVLNPNEVRLYIAMRDTKVVIKRAKS